MKQAKHPKILAYQYQLSIKNDQLSPTTDKINQLLLGYPWESAFQNYKSRARFYWGFSISGFGGDLVPIIDAKIETSKTSFTNPEFVLEVGVMPTKLNIDDRKKFEELLESTLEDEEFKVFWDNDPRGPRKRSFKEKTKILEEVKKLPSYGGEDEPKIEDISVSLGESLEYFGYESDAKPKKAAESYKKLLKEKQLIMHPDAEGGSEDQFLYLQKCRTVVEAYLKRYI